MPDVFEELRRIRRELHRIPEPAGKEIKTRAFVEHYIRQHTRRIRIDHHSDKGLIASYDGGSKLPAVAFRAELDGLPIRDDKELDYRSRHAGMNHACGHDAHMSILLQLLRWADEVGPRRNLVFIFQAAEEVLGGARELVPLLRNRDIGYMFAVHVTPDLYPGYFALRGGTALAGALTAELGLELCSGHAADQQDVMELLAQVHAFQREYNDERRICKVTHIETNGYYNAVPDRITFFLSFRSADEEANRSGYAQLLHRMQHNGSVRSVLWNRVVSEYPAYANDPILAERIRGLLGKRFGQESVLNSPFLFSSDDFAFYARDLPGLRTCYFFIGAYIREHNAVHTASFDIGEEALLYGYESLRAIVRMFEQAEERAERIRLYETGSENDESIPPLYL
ncbi:amidohydrolase [Paenibacillus sp. FSL W8-0194]|uniref:M20 metallopeptidase family protein n=1 Tax=Paenibacillus sp. FSL W8-0194 TaxID=2921711 RepID=UPI0030D83611